MCHQVGCPAASHAVVEWGTGAHCSAAMSLQVQSYVMMHAGGIRKGLLWELPSHSHHNLWLGVEWAKMNAL
jgi:hypothetical protein